MGFQKVFHIDCGRKYFSPEELKTIISVMGEHDYTQIELAFGNDGLRFLLDDMTIETDKKQYDSETVKAAIRVGNRRYCDLGRNELTESEMVDLIAYAAERGIKVLPLLNTPGHMDALVTAMEELGMKQVRFRNSVTTVDLDHAEAVAFTRAVVTKYMEWFAKHGSIYFNMGCDEYANDALSSGFAVLTNPKDFQYDKFIGYVNTIAEAVLAAGLQPVMFNDGMYYDEVTAGGMLKREIICSYWSEGWPGYTPAKAAFVEKCGHAILNTANNWYYVLGRRRNSKNNAFHDKAAIAGQKTVARETVLGGITGSPMGAMLCLWCDEPKAPYTAEEAEIVCGLIRTF